MNHNIVLIEDDPFIKQMYSSKIEEMQINVFTALNQDELKLILDKNQIDLILLDLILPNTSGFDILKWLKKESKFKDISVIVLSNLSSQADINQAFELGVVDYIVKSNYTPTEVMRTIQKNLPQT
jgi:two-component system, sensor histidine kinase and response regulator